MIAFEVVLNGKRTCVAGVPGYAVLTAIVTWVHRHARPPHLPKETSELTLSVSGLDSNSSTHGEGQHLYWFESALRVGDKVQVTVVERDTVDEPRSRRPTATPEQMEQSRKRSARYYLREYKLRRAEINRAIARLRKEVRKVERHRSRSSQSAPPRTRSRSR